MGVDRLLSASVRIAPNAPEVVSETRDGEAIIMHHGSGAFFNTMGSGAVLWEQIERGTTPFGLSVSLSLTYGLPAPEADAVVGRFLALLTEHGLISIDAEVAAPAISPPAPLAPQGAFEEPELGVHTDLADMLLLDPIHEVDAVGWPVAAPAAA